MDLTEPQAGSDLGAIVTRATEENGRYFLDGQKIFITNGGAGVHLVLAREAETFEQTKGTTKGLVALHLPARAARRDEEHGSPSSGSSTSSACTARRRRRSASSTPRRGGSA